MMFRVFVTLLSFLFIHANVAALECDAVFPGDQTFAVKGTASFAKNNKCNGKDCNPVDFSRVSPVPTILPNGAFYASTISDGVYQHSTWGLGKNANVAFSGSGTAVIYFNSSITIRKGTDINTAGNPENVLIIVNGSVTIEQDVRINGNIYSTGKASIKKNVKINGAVSAGGSLSVAKDGKYNYQASYIDNMDAHGFCGPSTPVIPISCSANLPAVAFSDDFSSVTSGWKNTNFTRNVSNWPADSITNSSGENTDMAFVIANGELQINGAVTTRGDNEYGMVSYDLSLDNIDKGNVTNYAISSDITANKSGENNDLGIVFGYEDDSNYYLARWNKYGTNYASNTSFPGVYRRLELVKVSAGNASLLSSSENFDVNDPFNFEVVVNDQGTAVCVNDTAMLYSATEQPVLKDFGIFSYDNDVGVEVDNIEVRCDDCMLALPKANYRFDECRYTGADGEVIDQTGNYNGKTIGNVVSLSPGNIEKAVDLSSSSTYVQTSVPLTSSFSVSTWFKRPTSTSGNRYFALGAMAAGGDLLYLDRGTNWRWGVYNASSGLSKLGTYSFSSLDYNWHHMVLIHANNQTSLYIDGVLKDSITIQANGTLKYIGTSYDEINTRTPQDFRAPLDEFMAFDGELSQTQITQIYNNQLAKNNYDGSTRDPVVCSDLIGFYQFEQTDFSSNITDTSGLDNHGTNIGGASTSNGKYCRAFDDNGTNSSVSTNNAFSTGVDLDDDVGTKGTISFWFNSETSWNQGGYNGGERTLFDASLNNANSASDKYFALEIQSDGRLRFTFEDSVDGDFSLEESSSTTRNANTWYYVSVTWDYTTDTFQILVDGVVVAKRNINTNGQMIDLGPLIFGDNSSTYSANNNSSLASWTSANGKFDEVRVYSTVKTSAEIQADMIDTNCVASLNHYQILHDGNGLTCDSETVTIMACSNVFDGTCSPVNENGSFTLNVTGANSSIAKTGTFINGVGTVDFNYIIPEQVALALSNESPAPAVNGICLNGNVESCNMQFSDAGFRFYSTSDNTQIGNQIAGKPSETLYIQAVEKNTATGQCQAALIGQHAIELAAECENPSSCSANVSAKVSANSSNVDILTTNAGSALLNGNFSPSVSLDFGDSSQSYASFTLMYPDAGQIRLHAKYKLPEPDPANPVNQYISGTSNSFVVSPFGFYMNFSPDSNTGNTSNPAATNAGGDKFKKAGELFTTTITAVQWQNGDDATKNDDLANNLKTPNFGNEINPLSNDVRLTQDLVKPLPGALGSLSNSNFINFNNGIAKQDISWSEVGIIAITANLAEINYLGANTVTTTAPYVGRFYPDHFAIGNIINGDIYSRCEATNLPKNYTYVGEKTIADESIGALSYGVVPTFTITAKAYCSSGTCSTTENYIDGFDKLTDDEIKLVIPSQDYVAKGTDTTTKVNLSASINTPSMVNDKGVITYTFNPDDHYVYIHDNNSKRAEFIADINLEVSRIVELEDDVKARDADPSDDSDFSGVLTLHPTGTLIRFGRWTIENAYGPETADLISPMAIEVFDGNKFITHVDDSCTSPLITAKKTNNPLNLFDYLLTDEDTSDNLNIANTDASISGKFENGLFDKFIFSAPNNNRQGPLKLEYEVPSWLKYDWTDGDGPYTDNPRSLISFGLFRGNDRIISWREVGN
ncbi:DUF6701 domain-containing protein [Thalassotalea piscium]